MRFPASQPHRLAAVALLLAAGCSTEPIAPAPDRAEATAKPAPAAPAFAAGELRLHSEPLSRVRFPVPSAGVSVDELHYDVTLPAKKFRHSIRLAVEGRTVVLVDVWDNPARLALRPWFDAHLAFLAGARTTVSERPMSRARTTGILLHEPASPEARSQAIAVFASGEQVFRVTAIDDENDAEARRLFELVVDQIEVGVLP